LYSNAKGGKLMDDEQFELLYYFLNKDDPLTLAEIRNRDYLLTIAREIAEEILRKLGISRFLPIQ
jgi:hypothetical protein